MGNLQCTAHHFSFVDVMLPTETSFDVVHSAMGWAGCSVLSYNAQKPFCTYILPGKFGVQLFDETCHPGAHFQLFASAWQFEMTENRSRLHGSDA